MRNSVANRIQEQDKPIHDWYRFVLSFPPHLVRTYLERFQVPAGSVVFDPFAGTGTTLVEAMKLGYGTLGVEANPMAHFASSVKTNWSVVPDALRLAAHRVSNRVHVVLPDELRQLEQEKQALLLSDSISPAPLHRVLSVLSEIDNLASPECGDHLRLALATTAVADASNLRFAPEVSVSRPLKDDAPVLPAWFKRVEQMAGDLDSVRDRAVPASVHLGDARHYMNRLERRSVDFVFTSPPYPNEKDYTRATRLESVLLGFMQSRDDLRAHKRGLLRSNSRSVYVDDQDDQFVAGCMEVHRLATEIEHRRLDLGKQSGFERSYARVVRLYFGGMARHLATLRPALKSGATLCYVVGDQASYFQVLIPTGKLLAQIAETLGYEVVGIDLFRTRQATATRQQINEEVVILQWKGR